MAYRISSEEMQELDVLKNEARQYNLKAMQLELILRVYIGLGLLIAFGALVYFGFSFLKIELTTDQRMSLMVAGAGGAVTVMSALMLVIRRQQIALRNEVYHSVELGYDVVREWAEFEGNSRRVLGEKGIPFNARSPRSIISMLQSNDLISHDLAQEISLALDIRNRVVHQVEPVPRPAVQEAGRILAESNEKLNRILQGAPPNQMFGTVGVKPEFYGRSAGTNLVPGETGRKIDLSE